MERSKGLKRIKELFLYSDSEPNEVLIGLCHAVVLPFTLVTDLREQSYIFIGVAICAGVYQLYSALWSGCLAHRLRATQFATLISLLTIENLITHHQMSGSSMVWVILLLMAIWNTVRVTKEKLARRK